MDRDILAKAIEILERDRLIPCKITPMEEIRSSSSESSPLEEPGINIKLENELFGNKDEFLTSSFCEDLTVYGTPLATEFLRSVYEDEWNEFLAKHSGLIS